MVANKLIGYLIILTFVLGGCSNQKDSRQEQDTIPFSWKDERIKDSIRHKRIVDWGDSVNLENLKSAIIDSLHTQRYLMSQFLRDTVPKNVFKLLRLEDLKISASYIRTIPKEICNLKKLTDLDLMGNKLTDIDNLICLHRLKVLSVQNNSLTILPKGFDQLDNLRFLQISNNDFSLGLGSKLPANLEEIYVGYCRLNQFPPELLKLTHLKRIYLDDNPGIKKIPSEIFALKNLERLDLNGTGISQADIDILKAEWPTLKIDYSFSNKN